MWVAVATVVAGVGGAYLSSEGSKDAAETQAAAAGQASNIEMQQFRESMAMQEPWQQAGVGGLEHLQHYLGVGGRTALDRPDEQAFYSSVGETRPRPTRFDIEQMYDPQQYDYSHSDTQWYMNRHLKELQEGWDREQEAARVFDEEGYQTAVSQWEEDNQNWQKQYGTFDISPEAYEESPYKQFLVDEGVQAREASASARGGLRSGAQLKALEEYGQNVASMDYGNWINRQLQGLSPYQSLAGLGQTSATQMGGQTMGLGTSLANNALYAGGAQAQNQINQANIWGNALTGAGQMGMTYAMNRPKTVGDRPVTPVTSDPYGSMWA